MARKCSYCQGKGLFPFCEVCFHSSDRIIAHVHEVTQRKQNDALKSSNRNTEHWKKIARHRFLENCKDLKKMLHGALRSRKLLTGSEGANEIINDIVSYAIEVVHGEIDEEILTEYTSVINRFDELLLPPLDLEVNPCTG